MSFTALTLEEIEQEVYRKYKIKAKERNCINEAFQRQYLRSKYRKKLLLDNGYSIPAKVK